MYVAVNISAHVFNIVDQVDIFFYLGFERCGKKKEERRKKKEERQKAESGVIRRLIGR